VKKKRARKRARDGVEPMLPQLGMLSPKEITSTQTFSSALLPA